MTHGTDDPLDTARLYERVVEIIADHTGYDRSYLLPESHFEAELGIDSITLQSILETVRERFGTADGPLAESATVGDLVDALGRVLHLPETDRSAPADTAVTGQADAAPEDPVLAAVLTAAMAHTGYRSDQLGLDTGLESELGIDSVILASVVAETADALGLDASQLGPVRATTLRELVTVLASARRTTASEPEPGSHDGEWDSRSTKDFVEQRDRDLFAKTRSFRSYLRGREQQHLYWYGMPLRSRSSNRAVIFDELTGREREFLMFASNNYLGLANHPRVVEAVCDATRAYGATHTGSRFIGGTNMLHKELERRLAAFKQRSACIVFPGGYAANLGTVSALVKNYDTLVVDRLNHMSIVDGGRLSGGIRKIYQHNDMADLERILARTADQSDGGTLVVADGVFSMHGDICDLPEIVRLAKTYGSRVLIDDAHSTGVLGARGSGTAEHFGLKGEVDLELGTMSKALAGMGGFVVGDEDVIEYLRYYANSYVFAANIPAGVAAGLIASLDVIETEPERLKQLWTNIEVLRGNLLDAGFDLEHSQSAILPIVIGDERKTMEMGRAVRARGLFCQTVVYPGVSLGDARLRVSVTCEHTRQDLDLATEIFTDAARETGVLPEAR
ncbi:aminotransferase class I/II-fold pyridoxal phosphate-dependent enzyme [Streptomyces sp. NPDC008159]|uniref:aminotransferase class I/II-fold pyridoxal phosphate-dependent enzyme n=1 Tax=Streptomyces sp. NPDC008159 TaxID=3364817 RepID=UPI0036E738F0